MIQVRFLYNIIYAKESIIKENNIKKDNPIERSFAKVLTYGFTEKSNMSEAAKIALNASVSKGYRLKNMKENKSISITSSKNDSDVVDFREVNQKIIRKLGQSNFLKNLPKGVRVVG